MKLNAVMTLAMVSTLSVPALASNDSRWHGELILATGYLSTNSNLSTEGDRHLTDLDGKGSHTNDFIVMPLGSLNYELNDQRNQRLYLGTSRDDLAVGDLAFEVGYQYDFANGTQLDFAILPTVVRGEVWANPYDTDNRRRKEDVEGMAYRFKVNNLMNSGFSLDMGFATMEVDNEGIEPQSLHRDADTYYLKGSYRSMFSATSGLITAFAYTHHDAEGDAASFDQYKGELTYFRHSNGHSLALTGSYAYREYDAINPIFDTRRNDDRYRLFLAYEQANFLGWQNWSLVSFNGVQFNTSSIGFYENEEYLTSLGLSYRF
ncbi:DUF2860 family protein [Ferrimonas marina]|uniref:DUF2860 domain-containing protein n=1 Tax=Ferrimonas marina TaxID=299255 RepID=A0A1M5NFW7_9GAMM|nr:DUF2860 family protein [Ferrimonas marina]SHG88454.1 Protein of unknown function [Ferrimonas marina]